MVHEALFPDIDTLRRLCSPAFAADPAIQRVYVFGSVAEGQAGPESDIDFGILCAGGKDRESYINLGFDLYARLSNLLHTNRIDVIVLNASDNPGLRSNIIDQGRVIFDRSGNPGLNRGSGIDAEATSGTGFAWARDQPQVQVERIRTRLASMRRSLELLRELARRDIDQVRADPLLQGALERYLFLAVQSSIDLAEMLCTLRKLPKPVSMSQGFVILEQAGVIPGELASSLQRMVGFRNALVHGYENLDYTIIERVLNSRLDELEEFGNRLEAAL